MTCSSRGTPRRLLLVVAFLLSATQGIVAQELLTDRIDAFVRDEMRRQQVPGVGIGVVQRGTVIKVQGYGLANLEHQVPVGPTTIFQSSCI